MICTRRWSGPCRSSDSSSSCAAWLMAPSGLRISWAMPAVSRPSAASLSCWACWAICEMSSRKIRVCCWSPRCRCTKLGCSAGPPGWTCRLAGRRVGLSCHCCRRSTKAGQCGSMILPSSCSWPSRVCAPWLASSTRRWLSSTRMPVRMRCRICALSASRLATSAARCSARCSLTCRRRDRPWTNSAAAKHSAPRAPAWT
ncbi:hypothetical protein D9M70_264630 [compost metagenome]